MSTGSAIEAIIAFNIKYSGKVSAEDIVGCPECGGKLHMHKTL